MTTAHKKSRLTGLLVIAAIASPTALMADTLSVGKLLERAQSRSQTQAVGILVARLGGERAGPAPAEIRPSTVAVEPETRPETFPAPVVAQLPDPAEPVVVQMPAPVEPAEPVVSAEPAVLAKAPETSPAVTAEEPVPGPETDTKPVVVAGIEPVAPPATSTRYVLAGAVSAPEPAARPADPDISQKPSRISKKVHDKPVSRAESRTKPASPAARHKLAQADRGEPARHHASRRETMRAERPITTSEVRRIAEQHGLGHLIARYGY